MVARPFLLDPQVRGPFPVHPQCPVFAFFRGVNMNVENVPAPCVTSNENRIFRK